MEGADGFNCLNRSTGPHFHTKLPDKPIIYLPGLRKCSTCHKTSPKEGNRCMEQLIPCSLTFRRSNRSNSLSKEFRDDTRSSTIPSCSTKGLPRSSACRAERAREHSSTLTKSGINPRATCAARKNTWKCFHGTRLTSWKLCRRKRKSYPYSRKCYLAFSVRRNLRGFPTFTG